MVLKSTVGISRDFCSLLEAWKRLLQEKPNKIGLSFGDTKLKGNVDHEVITSLVKAPVYLWMLKSCKRINLKGIIIEI